jgi:hypothetical protein
MQCYMFEMGWSESIYKQSYRLTRSLKIRCNASRVVHGSFMSSQVSND